MPKHITDTGNQIFADNVEVLGNLTVDTNTLFVDAVNNRVGVGTATPSHSLTIASGNVIGFASNSGTWNGATLGGNQTFSNDVEVLGNISASNLSGTNTGDLSSAQIISKVGERLIASLTAMRASNAGTCYFATTRATSQNFTVRTSTGYARLVNSDNTLGAQAGTGNANSNITLTIPASGLHRALGIISVVNGGTVRSGNITNLTCSNNQLTTFSGTGLTALTALSLSNNQLTTFSGTGLSALTTLNLMSNQLTTFSGTGLSALTTLFLNNNQLTTFSGTGMSELTQLNLDNNQLTTFSGTGLSALTDLNLMNNQITTFSGTGMSELTDLFLDNNQLTTFSGTGLSELTQLGLGNNQLTTFSATGLSALNKIIINDNQLTSIDMDGVVLNYGFSGSYGNGTYYYGSIFTNNLLNGPALDAFYTSLGANASGVISVSGNPGTASDDPTIATNKGYTVVGT